MDRTRHALTIAVAAFALAAVIPAVGGAQTVRVSFQHPGEAPSKVAYIVQNFTNNVARARAAGRSAAGLSNAVLHATRRGEIELTFHAKEQIGALEEASLRGLGASIDTVVSMPARGDLPPVGVVQARMPFEQVAAAARLPWVVAVTPPDYGVPDTHPMNPINSQGVAFHNADDVLTRGINGAGVTVGVISDGVTNLAASQGQNELPAVTVFNAGSGDEGTAMLAVRDNPK